MSSIFKSIANIPTSLVNSMSTTWFPRFWGKAPAAITPAPVLTAEEQAEDRAAFEKAITDAVAAAIKNEEFTQAVASNLASQLEPILKAALDLSSIEAKLLAANDQLTKRVDEADTQTVGKLAGLSSLVDTTSTTNAGKIEAIEAAVAQITASLSELGSNVKELQSQVASPDTSVLSSHTAKLDNITTQLVAIKANPETAATLKNITAELSSIKADIKNNESSVKILEGIKASNDSHASHAATLADIKSANDAAAPTLAGIHTQVGTAVTALSAIQNSDVHNEILSAAKASNESHAAHTAALSEIKAATATPVKIPESTDVSGLETSVKSIITTLDTQKTTLSEIKAASSNADVLSAIKSQDAVLAEIKGSTTSTEVTTSIQAIKSDISSSKDAVIEKVEAIKTAIAAIPAPAASAAESSKPADEAANGKAEEAVVEA
jgi:hypothetical protein